MEFPLQISEYSNSTVVRHIVTSHLAVVVAENGISSQTNHTRKFDKKLESEHRHCEIWDMKFVRFMSASGKK